MDENTVEYLTIEACTADIELAVRNNLTPLSGKLIACGLIDGAQSRQLTNRMLDETDRAHQLVQFVQAKVAGNKKHYSSFVKDVLGANRAHYRDIIEYLETKYREIERDHEVSMEQPKPNTKPTREERIQSDFGSDGAANDEPSKLTVESTAGVEKRTQANSGDTGASPKETEIPMYDIDEAEINFDPVPEGSRLKDLESYAKDVQLILHTVNDNEITAVVGKMQCPDIDGFEKPTSLDAIPFRIVLGEFGGYKAAQVNTEMGADCAKDLKAALKRLPNARTVIAVGVAYGSDRKKYKYGDVLVSEHMHSVKNIRLQPDEIISRPNIFSYVKVADYLTGIFVKGKVTWKNKFQCNKETESDPKPRYAKVHCGSVISAPMLVADEKSRDALLRNFPSGAIGGEMEGGVLLEIQNEHNADSARRHDLGVIIIKGVADFGDSQKQEGKQWQYTAALAAVSYIEHKLNMTGGRLFKTEPENAKD